MLAGIVASVSGHSQSRSQQTTDIERMLQAGHPVSDIARWASVSQQRVSFIKKRLEKSQPPTTPISQPPDPVVTTPSRIVVSVLKPLTLHLTPSVFDALTEACAITNRRNPDDTITVQEYVEELTMNRLAELGLLRKQRRK